MADQDWCTIRVSKALRAELLELVARVERAYELGHMKRWWGTETLTMNGMIRRLLTHFERQKARTRKSKRKASRPSTAGSSAELPGSSAETCPYTGEAQQPGEGGGPTP